MSSTDVHQPKTVIWRGKYSEHLGQVQGVLDFDMNFDNAFQRWKLVMEFIEDVLQAIEQGIIPLQKHERTNLMPNKKAIYNMKKIWHENTWIRVIRSSDQTKVLTTEFFIDKPSKQVTLITTKNGTYIKPKDHKIPKGAKLTEVEAEVFSLPKLKNMLPIGEIKEDVWGIRIRETMTLKRAWEGANYGTIVNDGNFTHYLSDGAIPKFEAEDMESETLRTYVIHRPVYHAIMDILPKFFNKYYYVFSTNVQKIKDWLEELEMEGFEDFLNEGIYEEPE